MIRDEEHYYVCPKGNRYEVGDIIPVLRLSNLVLFNETVILATCDMCDWQVLGPTSMVQSASQAHVGTHIMNEMMDGFDDDFRHPDFTE